MCRNSNKMNLKLFQIAQLNLATAGFTPNQQNTNRRQWSPGQIGATAIYSIDIVLFGAYVLFEANSLGDYISSIFGFNMAIALLMAFINWIFKNDKLFEMIEQIRQEMDSSA